MTFSITIFRIICKKNKQLINLLYYNVKNLTSILNFCIGPKCVTSDNDNRMFDNPFKLFLMPRPENHLHTNKQLINLLYNDVKTLTSIFRYCKVIKRVPSERSKCVMCVR